MPVTYNPRGQCLRALSAVLACYGITEQSQQLWDSSYQPENLGPGLTGSQMARMLEEAGVPCRLIAFEPHMFDYLNEQKEVCNRPLLLQIKGVGAQTERFFAVAALNPYAGANIYLNLPRGFDIDEAPPRETLFTGIMVVPESIPQGLQEELGKTLRN